MDEAMENVQQTSEDAFLEGWSEDDPVTTENHSEEQENTQANEETQETVEETPPDPEQPEETTEEETPKEETPPAEVQTKPEEPKTWRLRHLDEEKMVNEQEMTALAQKGLDYDRIREKYDESKPVMDLFRNFAKQAGMTVPDYVTYLRTQAKKAGGMNDADAKRAVELEDREAAVAEKEQQQKEVQKTKDDAEERRKADIAEFQKTFPDAAREPNKIPQTVWDNVRSGMSLVAAYAKFQVEQAQKAAEEAKQQAAAQVQNQKNASRSTGSMKSAGEDTKEKDPFLDGFFS